MVERFWEKVKRGEPDDCWPWWAGAIDANGYGKLRYPGGVVLANRYSYMLHYGPIPPDGIIRPTCEMRNCVNPRHLMLIQQRPNCCRKGHALTPENTYIYTRNGFPNRRPDRRCRICQREGFARRSKITRKEIPKCPNCGTKPVWFGQANRRVLRCLKCRQPVELNHERHARV